MTENNTVRLALVTRPVTPVDEETIRLLQAMLEQAKAGKIQGVLIATVESDGGGSVLSVGTAYAGAGVRQNVHAGLGAVEALQRRFARERLEDL